MQSKFSYIITHKFMKNILQNTVMCIGVSTPPLPQKNQPLFLANPALINLQTAQAPPLFRQCPLYIGFS